ncbi:cation:proton antiporter, partial [Candidatus Woesearchaeota archaeon]|nr:cation:proton antiporter [Candidatus Woesearchaeota archaeon]
GLKTFMPKGRLELIESEIRTICYGFFAPIFFLWVGSSIDIKYIFSYPLLILLVFAVSSISKLVSSYIIGAKELGRKKSILMGIGLSVRFSTSIIIVKILLDKGIIREDLYSVIIASSIIFLIVIPIVFSNLLLKWKVAKTERS